MIRHIKEDKMELVHLGIIMDGNRRWAKNKGTSSFKGHYFGAQKAKEVIKWCGARKIRFLTLYAFSTENWQRPKKEVSYLMKLLKEFLKNNIEEFHEQGNRIVFSGSKKGLSKNLVMVMDEAEELTAKNTGMTVNLLINYGGRNEIIDAIKKILKKEIKEIKEEDFYRFLYIPEIPDPDLIIRTGGEQRISNFLLWQSAYSELYFCKNFWPDFSEKDLEEALEDYSKRKRRKGR
jgi:undecaprenyl diphosphate synthase